MESFREKKEFPLSQIIEIITLWSPAPGPDVPRAVWPGVGVDVYPADGLVPPHVVAGLHPPPLVDELDAILSIRPCVDRPPAGHPEGGGGVEVVGAADPAADELM